MEYAIVVYYCGNMNYVANLNPVVESLHGPEKNLCHLAVLLGKIKAGILQNKFVQGDLDRVLEKLFIFLTNSYSHYYDPTRILLNRRIVKMTLECYFSYTSFIDYASIFKIENIKQFGIPNMLDILNILLDFNSSPDITLIKSFITSSISKYLSTDSLVEIFLRTSHIYFKIGLLEDSRKFHKLSIKSLHSYGFHKDFFLLEVLALSSFWDSSNKDKIRRYMDLLTLSNHLQYATDNDGTDIIPSEIIEETIKSDEHIGSQCHCVRACMSRRLGLFVPLYQNCSFA